MKLPRGLQVVIARYQEAILWARGLPAVVYNKGPRLTECPPKVRVYHLPNVGREAHTYLTHIVVNYDDLADWTLFTQGCPRAHLPECPRTGPPNWDKVFAAACGPEPRPDIIVPYLVRLKEWNDAGWLDMNETWRQVVAIGRVQKARLSFVDYFREHFNFDLANAPEGLCYAPGAILLVRKERILSQSKALYERLLQTVSGSSGPEEAHYLERAWVYLFSAPRANVHSCWLHGTVEAWQREAKGA